MIIIFNILLHYPGFVKNARLTIMGDPLVLDVMPLQLLGGLTAADLWPTMNAAMLGWLLLAVAPRWKYTSTLTILPPLLHSAIYLLTMGSLVLDDAEGTLGADFTTLEGVATLFQNHNAVFIGWFHYLAFDLLIGRTICEDSIRRGVSWKGHVLFVVPCLLFTLMLGPIGWISYIALSPLILGSSIQSSNTNKTKNS
eukprot:scaffold474080_cov63-Attheya_sp.AAC.1